MNIEHDRRTRLHSASQPPHRQHRSGRSGAVLVEVGDTRSVEWTSASDQMKSITNGLETPSELRDAGIERCERVDPQLGFLTAELYDRAPPGVPILLKDAGQEIAGTPHWAGLAALREADARSQETTPLATRLEAVGFSIIGKSACPPLANGVTTEPPGFPPTRNPWGLEMSVGGSSGGASAAVASGAVPIAHGSDATGSLRFPAALCGLVTLVPTARLIDSVPPCGQPPNTAWRDFVLARDAADLSLVFELLTDSTAVVSMRRRMTVGVLDHDPELGLNVDEPCQAAVRSVAELLAEFGHKVEWAWPTALNTLWQRIGAALPVLSDATRPPVLRWIERRLGRPVNRNDVPDDVLDAAARDHARSADDRARARATIDDAIGPLVSWWDDHDLLVTPATFKAGWPLGGTPGLLECGTLAAPFSLTGQPSLVIPVPRSPGEAPVGTQIVGRHGSDHALLELAKELQVHLDWLGHTPPIFAR